MNVSFLENNPVKSVIVDSSNGQPILDVQTPWKFFSRTTTIRRLRPGVASAGEVIAEIHWHRLGSSTITLYGTTMRVKDWLRKDGMFSSSRILTASDGNSYKWSHGSNKFTLMNTKTRIQVAQSHSGKHGWLFGTPRRMNIDISPQAIHILETIVTSFVIMEETQRQRENSSASAGAASSSG